MNNKLTVKVGISNLSLEGYREITNNFTCFNGSNLKIDALVVEVPTTQFDRLTRVILKHNANFKLIR